MTFSIASSTLRNVHSVYAASIPCEGSFAKLLARCAASPACVGCQRMLTRNDVRLLKSYCSLWRLDVLEAMMWSARLAVWSSSATRVRARHTGRDSSVWYF